MTIGYQKLSSLYSLSIYISKNDEALWGKINNPDLS